MNSALFSINEMPFPLPGGAANVWSWLLYPSGVLVAYIGVWCYQRVAEIYVLIALALWIVHISFRWGVSILPQHNSIYSSTLR